MILAVLRLHHNKDMICQTLLERRSQPFKKWCSKISLMFVWVNPSWFQSSRLCRFVFTLPSFTLYVYNSSSTHVHGKFQTLIVNYCCWKWDATPQRRFSEVELPRVMLQPFLFLRSLLAETQRLHWGNSFEHSWCLLLALARSIILSHHSCGKSAQMCN